MTDTFTYKDTTFSSEVVMVGSEYERNVRFDKWKVTITNETLDRKATFDFKQGEGFGGQEPDLKNVIHCLLQDYNDYDDHVDALDLAHSMGYTLDTQEEVQKVRDIWKALKENHVKVNRLFRDIDMYEIWEDEFQDY